MAEPYADLRQRVAAANQGVAERGLVVHAFGNASEVDRDEGVFAIKPSGIPCQQVTAADIVVVSLETGERVWGDHRPSSDTPTHLLLYRDLPSASGIVHTHSLYATSWAQACRAIPCLGTTHADHFNGPVPVTRPLTPEEIRGDYEMNSGRVISELFGPGGLDAEEMPGALVASHGPFVWGYDSAGAVQTAAALELMATLATLTLAIEAATPAIGGPLLDRHFSRKHGPMAYYGQP